MIRKRSLSDAWIAFGIKPRRVTMADSKPMRKVKIVRDPSTVHGTFGVLTAGLLSVYSLELADHGNEPNKSCIPLGVYQCKIVESPKFGKVYEITNVPNRTNVLIHKGNYGADEGHGKSDIEGCVLVGNAIGEIAGQPALLSSKDAFTRFMYEMDSEPFELTIEKKA